MEKKLANVQEANTPIQRPASYWLWHSGVVPSCIFIRMALRLKDVRALLFFKWVWVDLEIRSKVQLVFSLLILVLYSLLYNTLLRLYGLRRDVLFSLIATVRSRLCCLGKLHIRLTFWCMNVNNCAGAGASTELRWSWCGFHFTLGVVGNKLVDDRA
jgi:hypothetical protein